MSCDAGRLEDGGDGFVPRVLIWTTLCEVLRPPEVEEVKRILGHRVIEKNEVCVHAVGCASARGIPSPGGLMRFPSV